MARFSPKIEIINHFDNLINRVDIDIDGCLQNYNDTNILYGKIDLCKKYGESSRNKYGNFNVEFFDAFNSSNQKQCQPLDLWTKSTKVVDYLNQVRMKTIEELRKAQDETLEYYKLNSSRFKCELSNEKNIDKLRSELFAQKFYFQVNFTRVSLFNIFNVFTFVTDFYMTSSDIDSLE